MNLALKLTLGDNVFEVLGEFIPGCEAPACSNPSSPRYSDCGDAAEFAPEVAHRVGGGNVTLDELARLYRPTRQPWAAREALAIHLLDLAQAEDERLHASGEACDDDDGDGGDGAIDQGF